MPRFESRLVDRREVAEGTMLFAFERPAGFNFVAGQFLTVTLPDCAHNDARGNRRVFSIASPPQDTARLEITCRMTGSALKRNLAEAALGSPVALFGPSGAFTLHMDPARPAVFIAGGIGITPFRSMLHDAAARRLPHRIVLIHSNRTSAGTAFHDELRGLAVQHPHLTYVPTMTQAGPSWGGERRYVDAQFLRDHLGDCRVPVFYLVGPPAFVAGVTQAAREAGADPDALRSEEFRGYGQPPASAQAGAKTLTS